jgi:hypothetical protein
MRRSGDSTNKLTKAPQFPFRRVDLDANGSCKKLDYHKLWYTDLLLSSQRMNTDRITDLSQSQAFFLRPNQKLGELPGPQLGNGWIILMEAVMKLIR